MAYIAAAGGWKAGTNCPYGRTRADENYGKIEAGAANRNVYARIQRLLPLELLLLPLLLLALREL